MTCRSCLFRLYNLLSSTPLLVIRFYYYKVIFHITYRLLLFIKTHILLLVPRPIRCNPAIFTILMVYEDPGLGHPQVSCHSSSIWTILHGPRQECEDVIYSSVGICFNLVSSCPCPLHTHCVVLLTFSCLGYSYLCCSHLLLMHSVN